MNTAVVETRQQDPHASTLQRRSPREDEAFAHAVSEARRLERLAAEVLAAEAVAADEAERNRLQALAEQQLADARKPKLITATLDWSLSVDCPKCGKSNDLASGDHDWDSQISSHIFNNRWDKLQGRGVVCEHCEHEFKLDTVEY